MTTHESNFASQMSEASRRYLYCGVRNDAISPVHICLKADDVARVDTKVTFDIDSILGFPSSLAVAKQGIRWNPTQMAVSDLQSDLHLNSRLAHYVDRHGRAHSVRRPLHQLPHYTLGRLVGFEDISLYLVFPHLYREEQQVSRLCDHDFRTWMDRILLPAVYQYHDSSLVQHYPSSLIMHETFDSSGVEWRSRRTERTTAAASFQFPPAIFPSTRCGRQFLQAVERPGLQHFRGVFLFCHARISNASPKTPPGGT